MEEIWKAIKGFEGLYEVSNFGRVRSLPRNGTINKIRILKNYINRTGYFVVSLSSHNISKRYTVHRLVAKTFISNPKNKSQVNHIDGNKLNNNINNLEWCTCQENVDHSIRTGLKPNDKGVNNNRSKFTEKDINFIRTMYCKKDKEYGCRALAKKFNVSKSTISYIINNKTYI